MTTYEILNNPTYAYAKLIRGHKSKEDAYSQRLSHELRMQPNLQKAIKATWVALIQSKIVRP